MRWLRGALIGLGALLMGIGGWHLFGALSSLGAWFTFGLWFLGPPVLSDAVIMPATAILGFVLVRRLPGWLRTPAVVALVMSTAVTAIALPFLGAGSRKPDNTSLLNRNYLAGWLLYLLFIWACAGGWAAVRALRARPATAEIVR